MSWIYRILPYTNSSFVTDLSWIEKIEFQKVSISGVKVFAYVKKPVNKRRLASLRSSSSFRQVIVKIVSVAKRLSNLQDVSKKSIWLFGGRFWNPRDFKQRIERQMVNRACKVWTNYWNRKPRKSALYKVIVITKILSDFASFIKTFRIYSNLKLFPNLIKSFKILFIRGIGWIKWWIKF